MELRDDDTRFDFNNREFFKAILDEFDIDRSEVCIIGSVVLHHQGIRENRDVDFVCTYGARRRIHAQVRKSRRPYKIKGNGGVKFGKEAGLTRSDRFEMFGLSDDEVVKNPDYHYIIDGFKLLRPEMELSIKFYRRNDKDKRDVRRIEEAIVGDAEWDWDLVHVVPPWERPGPNLLEAALDTLREEGPGQVLKGGIRLLWDDRLPDELTDWLPDRDTLFDSLPFYSNSPYSPPIAEVDVTELFCHQYDDGGRFTREDIVVALLDIYGELDFPDDRESTEIVIAPDGTLLKGTWQLASKLQAAMEAGEIGPGRLSVTARVSDEVEEETVRTWDWIESSFNTSEISAIEDCRWDLFDSFGLNFYAFLWPAAHDYFKEIEDRIADIADEMMLTEFSDVSNFDKMVRDIYAVDKRTDDWRIRKKIHELSKYDPVFRVVRFELSDPQFRRGETPLISSRTYDLKYDCRKDLYTELDDYVFDIILHVTDNYEQNAHVARIVRAIENDRYTGLDGETAPSGQRVHPRNG